MGAAGRPRDEPAAAPETFGDVLQSYQWGHELAGVTVAASLGIPEGTYRMYAQGERSPPVARLHEMLRRRTCPPELRRRVVDWLGGR